MGALESGTVEAPAVITRGDEGRIDEAAASVRPMAGARCPRVSVAVDGRFAAFGRAI